MKSLEKSIAFNPSYRKTWQSYYDDLTAKMRKEKLEALIKGLDHESYELCTRQATLVPYFFPDPILQYLFLHEDLKAALLPEKTKNALTTFGFFGQLQNCLDNLQIDLDLPEEPLPELLSHSGLIYIKSQARALIADKTVIDGGAYIGDTAKMLVRHYAPKNILALEPEAKSYQRMVELVSHWGLKDVIIPIQAALSDHSGTETLWGEGVGASVIQKLSHKTVASEIVETTSIDELVSINKVESVGLIKLDVEGNEHMSIRGAFETLRRDKPLLVVSIYHTAKDFYEIKPMIEELDLGYRFMVRKVTDDLMKELVLICFREVG